MQKIFLVLCTVFIQSHQIMASSSEQDMLNAARAAANNPSLSYCNLASGLLNWWYGASPTDKGEILNQYQDNKRYYTQGDAAIEYLLVKFQHKWSRQMNNPSLLSQYAGGSGYGSSYALGQQYNNAAAGGGGGGYSQSPSHAQSLYHNSAVSYAPVPASAPAARADGGWGSSLNNYSPSGGYPYYPSSSHNAQMSQQGGYYPSQPPAPQPYQPQYNSAAAGGGGGGSSTSTYGSYSGPNPLPYPHQQYSSAQQYISAGQRFGDVSNPKIAELEKEKAAIFNRNYANNEEELRIKAPFAHKRVLEIEKAILKIEEEILKEMADPGRSLRLAQQQHAGGGSNANQNYQPAQRLAAAGLNASQETIHDMKGNNLPLYGENGVYTTFQNAKEFGLDIADIKVALQNYAQTNGIRFNDENKFDYIDDLYNKLDRKHRGLPIEEVQPVLAENDFAARHPSHRPNNQAHQEAKAHYSRLIDGSINRLPRNQENQKYFPMLRELKRIGELLYDQDQEQAGFIRSLISMFADFSEGDRNTLYIEFGNIIDRNTRFKGDADYCISQFAGNAIPEEQKTQFAGALYFWLEDALAAGKIGRVQPAPLPPQLQPQPAPQQPLAAPRAARFYDNIEDIFIQPPRAQPQPAPAQHVAGQDSWRFWNNTKHFNMPQGLQQDEQEYVRFFMNRVMPKLEELKRLKLISDELIGAVIRGASMGLTGMVEQQCYIHSFSDAIDDEIAKAGRGNIDYGEHRGLYISPYHHRNRKYEADQRFKLISDDNPFFRDLDPRPAQRVATYCTLHVEDIMRNFAIEYNSQSPQVRQQKLAELKERAIEQVRGKLLGLSNAISQAFQSLVKNNADNAVWVRFIKAFNTDRCYDGTYDVIVAVAAEIIAADGSQDNRPPNKIFAKVLTEIPANLTNILTDEHAERFVNAVIQASQNNNKQPSQEFINQQTLDQWFGGAQNAQAIRQVVGMEGGHCRLTDPQMLELIYWKHVMMNEGVLPPGDNQSPIYKLFMEG